MFGRLCDFGSPLGEKQLVRNWYNKRYQFTNEKAICV